jgi:transporter family-2 protein
MIVALLLAIMAGALLALLAASQLIDHYGWVGFAVHPVSPLRVLGAVLVVGGVVLVQR